MTCGQEAVAAWEAGGSDAPWTPELRRHLEVCSACARRVDEVLAVRRCVGALPTTTITEARRVDMRARLMEAARTSTGESPSPKTKVVPSPRPSPRRSTWMWLAAAALLGVAVVGGAAWREGDVPVSHGTWIAEEGGSIERMSHGPDEIVALQDGASWFAVRPLPAGARFRVLAGDGEVEVRGTRFRCEVEDGRLRSVRVAEGHVLVRVLGRQVADLRAGQRWQRETPVATVRASSPPSDEPRTVAPSSEPPSAERPARPSSESDSAPRATASRPHRARSGPSRASSPRTATAPSDAPFRAAWRQLQAGHADDAARSMDGLLADPRLDPARRGEILYWSALAHARAGRRGLALTRLRRSQELAPEGWFAEEAAALQMRLSR